MCGIAGMINIESETRQTTLLQMRDAMFHRGPDDEGVWWSNDGRVGLAHRRLSIIDLSPAGHQPMQDESGELCIVFNGEIYNFKDLRHELRSKGHVFRSNSDTEVILAAYRQWGPDCLLRFNGMFAFAIYDANKQSVFLARDRAGEKPLFYSSEQGQLRFASELKGLMVDPKFSHTINPEALDCYLAMGFIPGELCVLEGVNKLPPAHAMLFDCRTATSKVWPYWQLPEVDPEASIDEEELVDELDALLEDSIRQQLVADVPVGVLLSGGVDSSLITAMASRTSNHVKTFTVGFQGSAKHDESAHARLIADHFGTDHLELQAGNVDIEILPGLARQYDEPMCDSSMIPTYLVSKLVRQHCTVALGGDGGDELFGGYIHYNRLLWTQRQFGWMPLAIRNGVSKASGFVLPTGFKGRNWLQALGTDLDHELPLIGSFFDPSMRRKLLGGSNNDFKSTVAEGIREKRTPITTDLLQRATRMEFENYMPEDILVKVDRASMLNSLEIRAPLLDHRIIEFAFGRVPSHLKTTINQRKILLKRLAERVLPSEFDRQRKQGFSIPLSDWLKSGPWRDCFHDILFDDQCLFDKKTVNGLFHGQDRGRNNQERLFCLTLFELWRREYQVSL